MRPDVQRLDVGPLEDDAAAELVHATAEGGGMPADVLGFILKHSQGMPLQARPLSTRGRPYGAAMRMALPARGH